MKDNLPTVPTKFCKNCHWFKQHWLWAENIYCRYPVNVTLDPVTGDVIFNNTPRNLRTGIGSNYCGKDGKWYEPKLS